MCTTFHSWFSLYFFVRFMEKKPPLKLYGAFDYFSRTYEVAKFLMNTLYLNVTDIMHANEYAIYANSGLHVNLWDFFLVPFCFKMKKDHFKKRFLLWPQVLFKYFKEIKFYF